MERLDEDALFRIIGSAIKAQRTKSGLNQTALAGQVGLSRTSLVNIERGRQHPSLILLWEIAKALDIELSDLIPDRNEVASAISGVEDRYIAAGTSSGILQQFRQVLTKKSSHESQETKPD